MQIKNCAIGLLACFVISACKTTSPPVFYYGEYQTAVYQYFKGDELNVGEQIAILQNVIQQAQDNGLPVAPGVHAHLGLLYFDSSNPNLGFAHFEQEKLNFPESSTFIDFLIANINQGDDL